MRYDMGWIGLVMAGALLSIGSTSEAIDSKNTNGHEEIEALVNYRLPRAIRPTSYEIILELPSDFNESTFKGTVKINATVDEETDEIVFNQGHIKILSFGVYEDSTSISINNTMTDRKTEKCTLKMVERLSKGTEMTIVLTYLGSLRNDMIGAYKSSYVNANGETKWLVATQFHAVHARHAFPCFDEPSFKATFFVRILRPQNYRCLSNMPLKKSTETPIGVWDEFSNSVVMSTYLVAFVVSDFTNLENSKGNFRVWARPNAIQQADYALDIGQQALSVLSGHFNEPFPLSKMDMVAIPDFSAGAMENWGLITYRESRMLFDEEESSATSEQDVASVIVHECVHSWFGNLVTPNWWDYLWLSEGFARYYQYITTAKVKPEWKMQQQFVVDQIQTVFQVDALESSNPMNRKVNSPTEIGTTGDSITYAKGASVIRMMELTFGSEIFNAGLREYLKERKYSSASPEDLWSALQNQVEKNGSPLETNVATIMDTWTSQAGFPVLTVEIVNREKSSVATFHQKRFLLRNGNLTATKAFWWIPVSWASEKKGDFTSTSPKYWLDSENGSIQIEVDEEEWIVFNVQRAGYYRVNYDKDSWYRIINVLTSDKYEDIHEVNRAAIVDDLMNLARVDLVDYDTALTGLNYIKREKNYLPFKAAFAGLDYLNKRFAGQESYHWISNFSVSIIEYVYEDLGYDDKPTDDRFNILLRKEINLWACSFDHPDCVDKSLNYFNEWRDKKVPIPKNQRQAVYCTAMRHGNQRDWNFLWAHYLTSNSAAEQLVILKGLGCTKNTTILEKYLQLAITNFEESGIRKQDSASVFGAVYESGEFGAEYILTFVANNHAAISKYYGGYESVARILSGASQRFSTQRLITKFQTFIQVHVKDFKVISESLKESLDLARYELEWFELHEEEIIAWMKKSDREEEATTAINPGEPTDTSNTTDYRLPTNILPKSYNIKLTPYIEPGKFTFDGIVEIIANVTEDTDKIVLHINEITIEGIAVTADDKHVPLTKVDDTINKYNFLTIYLSEILKIGATVTIQITYAGQLNTAMRGFYRSSYVNDAGETRWLATTHLEPVGARKMYPCFDEPALKAVFRISVNRPAEYRAISNTPLKSSGTVINGRVWDTFEPTPPMSTYLVALIVSDFKSLVDEANNCAVWARPNGIKQAEYALSVMAPLVAFFEKAVGHPYQISKLDMAAIPDFASGAMENWGLLTYRETNMLYDKNNSPITSKQAIADVISHEISHQWFGDEVSPRWWKYLWLSEGFARYFQYHGTAHVETEWGLESQFVIEQLHSAFVFDSLSTTHPMTHDVYSPSEISAIFDTISYAKSASVLRMVEKILGSDIFYAALHDYIAARSYNDATPEHLYAAFQSQIDSKGVKLNADFKTIMDSWTTRSGYPIVDVTIVDGVASLSQKRYLSTNPDNLATNDVRWIPITWASKSKPDFATTAPKFWLSKEKDSVHLNVSDEWVIFNVQQSGYYRVNYDPVSWNRIIDGLKSEDYQTIHEVNRASLLDDLLNLGKSGKLDYDIVLSATQYLKKETNYIPWRAAFNSLIYLNYQLNGTYVYELYRTHILTILLPLYEKLGLEEVESEPHYDKLLRMHVVRWACDFRVEHCIKSSLDYFTKWTSDSSKPVPVNIRNTVYCTAIKYGSPDNWEFLWKQYVSPGGVTMEKQVILNALGCSNDKKTLEKLLTRAITRYSEIRPQDSTTVFSAVYNSGLIGAEYTLDFVNRNYDKMSDYYEDYDKIATIIGGISSRFTTAKTVSNLAAFVDRFKTHLPGIQSSLESSLTRAQEELTWFEKYGPKIYEWLDRNYQSEDYRLPKNIKPIDYDIYLTPYLDENNFTFDGEIRINMEVVESTSKLVLLANELKMKNIIVYIDSVNPLTVSSYTLDDEKTHKLNIYLTKMVPAGSKLSAYITYTGILNDKNRGFYRSSYVDSAGKTRWVASTQFEPVYARQAFPCFDEPSFKAQFRINIERPNTYETMSNMPLAVSVNSHKPNWTYDSFEASKLMSSYLVAFVVSDFLALKNDENNFRVWARPDAYQYGHYALDVGQNVLKYLENFTGIAYPIRKMDLVAVPDFDMGAMENWGLVTFREYGLLYHENVTSAKYKRYLNTVVSHELVHMWFGNLVTCDWWDHIWLHEGFAQYIQWIASDYSEPGWKLLQQLVVYELQEAMIIDASPTIRPMNNKVSKPLLIIDTFDKIAYAKSASVIRMMHHAFGASVFEPALHTYLDAKKYSNAIPEDLWAALQSHEDEENSLGNLNVTIETLMDSWTNQAGYPVVTATWVNGLLSLEQKRFLISHPKNPSDESENLYWIPVTMTTKNESNFEKTQAAFWFGTKRFNMPLPLKSDEWFIINIQETGYYRVNYDDKSWQRLSVALRSKKNFGGIHQINRAQIVDDLLNLARADYVDYEFALDTIKYLVDEKNHLPWKSFFEAISFLNQRFYGHEIGEVFANFVLGLSQNMYNSIISYSDKKDDQLSELNRILITSWACKLGHAGCIESSKIAFDEWKKDENKTIPPNERVAVYCASIKEGNHEDWEFLWNKYESTNFASEKVIILGALGCSRNTSTINSYLKRAISNDNAIRYQDVAAAFSSVYGADKFGVDAALDFLVTNYKDVQKYYGNWSDVASLFSSVAGKISTQEQIDKLELFVNKTRTELIDISSSLKSSVENAKENLDWFHRHSAIIHEWLKKPPTELPKPDDNNSGDGNNASNIATYSTLCLVLSFFFVFKYQY